MKEAAGSMSLEQGIGPNALAAPHSNGITVIVVGLGIAGLTAAIESHRKGHTVITLDKWSGLKPHGDAIGITSNAARVVKRRRGGGFYQTLEPHIHHLRSMDMHDEGTFHHRNDAVGYRPPDGFHLNRGELVRVIYEHALELGIDVRLGRTVTSFWGTDEAAGVVVDGARIAGDCVVASNGVHSKARGFITGEDPTPHPSGYSVFRTYFESRDLALDPEANWVLDGTDGEDVARVFVKEHTLLVLYTGRRAKDVGIMLTHQDYRGAAESWSVPVDPMEALECIKDWPVRHKLEPILRHAPKDRTIDFQLLLRPLLDTWVSPSRRMIIIGDAAHPNFLTSGQGAGQGIEDAATVAIALELAGKSGIPLVLQAVEKLRYRRATVIQSSGLKVQGRLSKLDKDSMGQNPNMAEVPRPAWIYGHDCQKFTYDEFAAATRAVQTGTEYRPSNVPAGDEYEAVCDYKGAECDF